eukprot:TRINITY_DN29636_c0_g1_i1.p1 TRINITY_DN29636_c0_g1~~TRINITY_DN29636_c0_g1_i1.p1  ORF type:complete len:402 (-),score=52.78 TRINITY_DN29636_c0_g1_i1:28-1233(-)
MEQSRSWCYPSAENDPECVDQTLSSSHLRARTTKRWRRREYSFTSVRLRYSSVATNVLLGFIAMLISVQMLSHSPPRVGEERLQLRGGRSASVAFAAPARASMTPQEAWKVLGVDPGTARSELKKALRTRIREVHPDVTGDDGTMLQQVRDAFAIVDALDDPTKWDPTAEDGLPGWAAGLLQGIKWSEACPSYASFLGKPDNKALAVGEMNERTGVRPWAASWGVYSQQEANAEAMRVCRQHSDRCRLIYVGSGSARQRKPMDPSAVASESTWWQQRFGGAAGMEGFGWIPNFDSDKERVIGYKTVPATDKMGNDVRVRVPVLKATDGSTSIPYYYSPLRPKERIHMKKANFKHATKFGGKAAAKSLKSDKRVVEVQEKLDDINNMALRDKVLRGTSANQW